MRVTEINPFKADNQAAYKIFLREELLMKSIRFWKMEVKQLSLTERMFFCDAIRTLFTWDLIKEEYKELDLIKRILESEIRIVDHDPSKKTNEGNSILSTHHRETRQ